MATMIPDLLHDTTRSERILFERLGRELDPDWIVLHSLGLSGHPKKLWGEADFVVISTKGLFVIEVKGGQVSCKDGLWKIETLDGRDSYTKREGPFEQAKDALYPLKKILARRPGFDDLLTGFGVVMPFMQFDAVGAEIEPGVLLDSRDFGKHLGFYVGRLSTFWQKAYRDRHGREARLPQREELTVIRQLLRPDVESTLSLGSYLNSLDAELIDLTGQQVRVSRGMENNPRTVTRGMAGTGKTILAVDRAKRLAQSGKRVLYLCFNRLLAQHVLENLIADPYRSGITVRNLHGFYRDVIGDAGLASRLDEEGTPPADLFAKRFPEVFVEAALTVDLATFDVLILDEAQDFLTVPNLEALDLLLDHGLRRGSWHLFLDPRQDIYGKLSEYAEDWLADIGCAIYELATNCRNTRPVAVETSIVSGIDLPLDGAIAGPECGPVFCSDHHDVVRRVTSEVDRLLAANVLAADIILLSPRRLENSAFADTREVCRLPLINIASGGKPEAGLHFCTMHAFKGLERKVVLAVDVEHIGGDDLGLLHYAGLSRAKTLLRTFVYQSERSAYERQARNFGQRLAGA